MIKSTILVLIVVSILSSCSGRDKTTKKVPSFVMETISDITGKEPDAGAGYAHICPGDRKTGQPRNILIRVNGFSPKTKGKQPGKGELEATCKRHDPSTPYHLVETRWSNGGDSIQRNGGFIRATVELLIDRYQLTSNDHIAMVGYSMGGLVARYALLDMEEAAIDHLVDLFVTVDSPHLGAYVPIGVQHIADIFKNVGSADLLATLNAPAAKQMLTYHYSRGSKGESPQTATDDHVQLFAGNLEGAYPNRAGMRTVAISSGRGDGEHIAPKPLQRYFGAALERDRNVRVRRKIGVCPELDITVNGKFFLIVEAFALGTEAGTASKVATTDVKITVDDIDVDNRVALTRHFEALIKGDLGLCGDFVPDSHVRRVLDVTVDRAKAEAKDWLEPYQDQMMKAYNDGLTTEGAPGGLGERIQQLRDIMLEADFVPMDKNQHGDGTNMFVSVGSALGIQDLSPTRSFSVEDYERMSPFDKIYIEAGQNLGHMASSHDWFEDEVLNLFSGNT